MKLQYIGNSRGEESTNENSASADGGSRSRVCNACPSIESGIFSLDGSGGEGQNFETFSKQFLFFFIKTLKNQNPRTTPSRRKVCDPDEKKVK